MMRREKRKMKVTMNARTLMELLGHLGPDVLITLTYPILVDEPKESKPQLNLPLPEVTKVLCPKCAEKVKQLIAQKLADRVMKG